LATFRDRVLSDDPLIRRMSYRAVFSAFGDGAFLTGSAVYFTQIVGLSAAQVGLGLTIAGIVSFFTAVPSGRLSDRLGSRESWLFGTIISAALFACWPLVHGFASYVAISIVFEIVDGLAGSGMGAYRLSIFKPDQRVRGLAFNRAYRNVGYTLGALAGGLALAVHNDTLVKALPLFAAAISFGDAILVWRMPSTRTTTEEPALEEAVEHAKEKTGALHNRGYLATMFIDGVVSSHGVLLNTVIPLWLVTETDAPRVLLAWLFGTNTVMAVLLQVRATRGINDVASSVRAEYRAAACFVLSCVVVLITHDTVGWVTIVLVWLGHVTVTGTELFQSAGGWGFNAELSDPNRLGEYQGARQLGNTLGNVWAPALYTFLAMNWGAPGWLLIGAIVVVAVAFLRPATRAAQRFVGAADAPQGVEPTTA